MFTVTELPADGAVIQGGPARFEWNADEPGKVGRRSSPRRPLTIATKVRFKRTDYPGGDDSTIQVLGANAEPITFQGGWDDRWNYAGYARETRRAFNDMVRRGNLVRIEFQGMAWTGIIARAEYPYDYDERIGYSFTLEPQIEEDAAPLRPAGQAPPPLSASQLVDGLGPGMQALTDLRQKQVPLVGAERSDLDAALDTVAAAFAEVDAMINTRIVQPAEETRLALLRVTQLFGQIRSSTYDAMALLKGWKADAQVAFQTAKSVLDFETWSRDMRAELRDLGVLAYESQQEVARRAAPDAKATYRPREGEHLMSVSTKFFGTPHQWRGIMLRNGLSYPVMTGDEILVIGPSGAA